MTNYIKLGLDIMAESIGRQRAIDYHQQFFSLREIKGETCSNYMAAQASLPLERREKDPLTTYEAIEMRAWGGYIRDILAKHHAVIEGNLEAKLRGE